eukprot:m.30007 g.30007  ORF g.30007 m.30007 type:complete len:149 (+) comp31282_c0_seq2:44-490(+)
MDLRSLSAEQSLLSRADGSARFSHGLTSVLVSVYGPVEVKQSKEKLNRATINVEFKPNSGIRGTKEGKGGSRKERLGSNLTCLGCAERLIEKVLRETCEAVVLSTLHPRSAVNIVVQLEHDDGSVSLCKLARKRCVVYLFSLTDLTRC